MNGSSGCDRSLPKSPDVDTDGKPLARSRGQLLSAPQIGAPAKGMLLAPERLLLALAEDGWLVRNKVIWAKSNPMPTSVGDRLSCTYDVIYLLVRSPSYFFDLDAIRVPHVSEQSKGGTTSSNPAPIGLDPWPDRIQGFTDLDQVAFPAICSARIPAMSGDCPRPAFTVPISPPIPPPWLSDRSWLPARYESARAAALPGSTLLARSSSWANAFWRARIPSTAVSRTLESAAPARRTRATMQVCCTNRRGSYSSLLRHGDNRSGGGATGRDWIGIEISGLRRWPGSACVVN